MRKAKMQNQKPTSPRYTVAKTQIPKAPITEPIALRSFILSLLIGQKALTTLAVNTPKHIPIKKQSKVFIQSNYNKPAYESRETLRVTQPIIDGLVSARFLYCLPHFTTLN